MTISTAALTPPTPAKRRHERGACKQLARLLIPTAWALLASSFLFAATKDDLSPESRWHGRWYEASPRAAGFDDTRLQAASDAIGEMAGIQGFVLVRSGYLVSERYWRGGAPDKPHNIKSASKSVISALIGIANAESLVGLDQDIAELLPRTLELDDPAKGTITVRQLLNMTSGLESTSYDAYNAWVLSPSWTQAALDRPLTSTPGTTFNYSTGNTHLLSAILTHATGMSTRTYAQQKLFSPMSAVIHDWQRDPENIHVGGNNLSLTPRDLAKFGQLFLDGGRWRGQQLIPSEWIATSTELGEYNGSHEVYGGYAMAWWSGGIDASSFCAVGYGGQYVLISPSHDTVIVVLATLESKGDVWESDLFNILQNGVLASLSNPAMPSTLVANEGLDLKPKPHIDGQTGLQVKAGTTLELLDRDRDWLRARAGEREGWLHQDSFTADALGNTSRTFAGEAIVQSILGNNEPVLFAQVDSAIAQSTTDGNVNSVAQPDALQRAKAEVRRLSNLLDNSQQSSDSTTWYRTIIGVNFRAEPSLDGERLRGIAAQTEFEVIDTSGPWLMATIDGQEGWLHSRNTVQVTAQTSGELTADIAQGVTAISGALEQISTNAPSDDGASESSVSEFEEVNRQLASAKADRERLLGELEAQRSELAELEAAKVRLASLETTLAETRGTADAMDLELATMRVATEKDQERTAKLEGQLEQVSASRQEAERSFVNAQNRLAEVESTLKETAEREESALAALEEQKGLENDVTQLRGDYERQRADIEERDILLAELRSQISELESLLEREQSARQTIAADFQRTTAEYQDQTKELEQVNNRDEESMRTIEELRAQLATSERDVADKVATIASLSDDRAKAETRSRELEGAIEKQDVEQRQVLIDLERLKSEEHTRATRLAELDEEIANRDLGMQALRAQAQELERLLEQQQTATRTLLTDYEQLDAERQTLLDSATETSETQRHTQDELDAARVDVARLQGELENAQEANTSRDEQVELATLGANELAASLSDTQTELDTLKTEYERQETERQAELEKQTVELKAAQDEIVTTVEAKQQLEAQVLDLTTRQKEQVAHTAQANESAVDSKRQLDAARAAVQELEQRLTQASARGQRYAQQLNANKTRFEANSLITQEQQEENRALTVELTELRKVNASQSGQLTALEQQVTEHAAQLTDAQDTANTLRKTAATLKGVEEQLAQAKKRNGDYEEQIRAAEQIANAQRKQGESIDAELASLRRKDANQQERITTLTQQVSEREQSLTAALEAEVTLRSELAAADKTAELDATKTTIQELEARIAQETERSARHEQQREAGKQVAQKQRVEREALDADLAALREESLAQKNRIAALTQRIAARELALTTAQSQAGELKIALSETRQKFSDENREVVAASEAERAEIESRLRQTEAARADGVQRLAQAKSRTEELTQQVEALSTQLEGRSDRDKKAADQLAKSLSKISSLERNLEQERAAQQTLAKGLERLYKERQTEREELAALRETTRRSELELEDANRRVAELEERTRLASASVPGATELALSSTTNDTRGADAATVAQEHIEPVVIPGIVDEPAATEPARAVAAEPVALSERVSAAEPASAMEPIVHAWALAWSQQDVDAYLNYYANEFAPANGTGKAAWEKVRRSRIQKPQFIEVKLSDIQAVASEPGRGRVTFRQAYTADHYQDVVVKTLELILQDGVWRIVAERSG